MSIKSTTRLVREGEFAAEVEVTRVEASGGWTPYLSLEDAYKLDDVRDALRAGDVKRAEACCSREVCRKVKVRCKLNELVDEACTMETGSQ